MRRMILEFIRRGLTASGLGPIILAIIYWILQGKGMLETLTVNEVCMGIVSLAILAFIAGGMNVIYQMERLPLMIAILIHGGVLYISYLVTYLANGWVQLGVAPILGFTAVFVLVYIAVWVIVYFTTKRKTDRLNIILKQKQEASE